jgi:membrane peptidoglycan carboxypeptidase
MASIRKWSVIVGVAAFVLPLLAFIAGYVLFSVTKPRSLIEQSNKVVTLNYSDGSTMARVTSNGSKEIVEQDQLPKHIKDAVLAAEDRDFYKHSGFSPMGIMRAVWNQATGGSGGGSTVTQQYIKNATGDDEMSLWRKYKEVCMAAKLEQTYDKDEILWAYLNIIYYGRGETGIQGASKAYFNKPAAQLDVAEAVLLAQVIQRPSQWDPEIDETHARERFEYVLNGMVEMGNLSPSERARIKFPRWEKASEKSNEGITGAKLFIRKQVERELEASGIEWSQVTRNGYTVQTTIDPKAQEIMEATAKKVIRAPGQPEELRTAAVSIEPKTGGVLAYYGGDDAKSFDFAEIPNQPGSSFKPFVVIAGLEQGKGINTRYDASSPYISPDKTSFNNFDGDSSCGNCPITVAESIRRSVNTSMVRMAVDVGLKNVKQAAHNAGIRKKTSSDKPLLNGDQPVGAGLALGQYPATPLDMANAYATIANRGMRNESHFVQEVKTTDGSTVVLKREGPKRAFDKNNEDKNEQIARNVTKAMEPVAGFTKVSLARGRPSAAKTGTHQYENPKQPDMTGNEDAWMVGFTPQVSTAVWVGTADPQPIKGKFNKSSLRDIYGKDEPSQIWKLFTDDYLKGKKSEDFGPINYIGSAPNFDDDFDDDTSTRRPTRNDNTPNLPTFTLSTDFPRPGLPSNRPGPGDESETPDPPFPTNPFPPRTGGGVLLPGNR